MPKKQLTIEEKMNNALVPEEEWPYKLPDNWCWVKLGGTCNIIMGQSPKGIDTTEDSSFTPLVGGAADLNDDFIKVNKYTKKPTKLSQKGDLIVCIRATLGRPVFSDKEYCLGRGVAAIRSHFINITYLRYAFLQNEQYLYDNSTGSTFAQVTSKALDKMPIPLPSLPEQQRIVDRIKSLFAKLDEAKEKIQNVLDGVESRKAAILHQAFTGKLTAKWRKENGVMDDSWEKKTLDSICVSIYDGDHMAPPKTESGIPFLVISNVNKGKLSFENTRFVSKEYYNSVSDTRKPQLGDVLYTIVGSYGIPVVVDNDRAFCFQRHMALLKPSKVDTYFLWYQLQTKEFYNKATEIATGTAQLTVPIKGLRKLKISLPVQVEQQEIVRRLDNLLNKEKSICESCEASLATIEAMKKAILAKAFRGELGTNNPAEESSKELLREIISI